MRKKEMVEQSGLLLVSIITLRGRCWTDYLRTALKGYFTDAEIDWAAANIRPAVSCQKKCQVEL